MKYSTYKFKYWILFTRQRNEQQKKKLSFIKQNEMIKDRKKIIHIAEGKLRKRKKSPLNTCSNTFQTLFHYSPLFFDSNSYWTESKIIISQCTMALGKKTIPKLIIFIFQKNEEKNFRGWREKKRTKPNVVRPSDRDGMQTKLKNQKWTCVHNSKCNCFLHMNLIYIGPNQTISFYRELGERSKIIEKNRDRNRSKKNCSISTLIYVLLVRHRLTRSNAKYGNHFFIAVTLSAVIRSCDDAKRSQLDYYYRFIINSTKKKRVRL